MTAAWSSPAPLLCLLCTALCSQGSELLWRTPGKDVSIQCRPENQDQVQSVSVMRGLTKDDVFRVEADSKEKPLIKDPFHGRLQYSGTYPNLDILIKNLYLNDTGPYWCICQKVNRMKKETETVKTKGSVLLVVSEMHQECPESAQDAFLVAITVAAAVLFCILAGFILWIILKTKKLCCAAKPRPATGNHQVYEDMRGTLRR